MRTLAATKRPSPAIGTMSLLSWAFLWLNVPLPPRLAQWSATCPRAAIRRSTRARAWPLTLVCKYAPQTASNTLDFNRKWTFHYKFLLIMSKIIWLILNGKNQTNPWLNNFPWNWKSLIKLKNLKMVGQKLLWLWKHLKIPGRHPRSMHQPLQWQYGSILWR